MKLITTEKLHCVCGGTTTLDSSSLAGIPDHGRLGIGTRPPVTRTAPTNGDITIDWVWRPIYPRAYSFDDPKPSLI